MESGDYGLTRGTRSIACRLELHAVAGLLWISWCVLGGADFSVFFFFDFFFFERTRPAASMRPPCIIYLSTSTFDDVLRVVSSLFRDIYRVTAIMRPFFAFRQESLFIPGCVQGAVI